MGNVTLVCIASHCHYAEVKGLFNLDNLCWDCHTNFEENMVKQMAKVTNIQPKFKCRC
jgi:hypothetical protein